MIMDRIKQYIDTQGISIAAFERSIGMSNASFGKNLKKGGAIGTDKLEYILNIYKNINPEWLLTGRGSMYVGEVNEVTEVNEKRNVKPYEGSSNMSVSVKESSTPYKKSCPYCQEKDKIISVLQKELDNKNSTINKLIDVLHHKPEHESNEYEQKRKAS